MALRAIGIETSMDDPSLLEVTLRPLVAVLLAGVLGWERGAKEKPAGLRTHMMVALGSASFTLAAVLMPSNLTPGEAAAETSRVIQGIVGGIGFLGAGAIMRSGGSVQGITTAATIWVVGAIGVGCGLGFYSIAGYTTLLAFLILTVMAFVERKVGDWIEAFFASRPRTGSESDDES